VHDITLWLLGGMSRIERGPENPSQDLRIALAGPGTSLAIAIGAVGVTGALDVVGAPQIVLACTAWLASVNVLLAVFNMVPATPLDGGRVLRAYLWRRRGDEASAAISATHAGRVFGYVLAALGFVEFAAGEVTGLWLVLLGGFLLVTSHAEEMQVRMNRDLKGTRVRDIMTADPITVNATLRVDRVLHDFVLSRHCSSFPVVDDVGGVVGLVTLRQLRQVPAYARATTRVDAIALPLSAVRTTSPDAQLLDVLTRENASDDGRVLVFDDSRLVGIVSPTDVARAIQLAEFELAQPPTTANRS
jgi:CBS domain-containing protein